MQGPEKQDIRALSAKELVSYFKEIGEKPFRAKQVEEWLWKKSARSFADMTSLSKELREKLEANFCLQPIVTEDQQRSSDGTVKFGFRLHDGHLVEGVLIPSMDRTTACISSQVGCNIGCRFCATGKIKMKRNLTAGEIYDQVVAITNLSEAEYGHPLTNIVYMGMGEPMLNYKNVMGSIDRITGELGLGMSPKRITVSTSGIAKMIKNMADDNAKVNLALSLHCANDHKRSHIMPINESNSLESLREAISYFYERTQTRITYEYVLLGGINDSLKDAKELAEFCKSAPCKINLIEYNPTGDEQYKKADAKDLDAFAKYLDSRNLIVNVRRSRGEDIDAACGQLANKRQNEA